MSPDNLPESSAGQRARLAMSSFPEFYRQYWPRLVRCLVTQAGDSRWAEDVAQETMLAAIAKWDELLTYERPDAWLFKVAIRRVRRLEAQARERRLVPEDGEAAAGDLGIAATIDVWAGEHLDLIAAIRSLPRRQAEVVVLHHLIGYTLAETGEILAMSEATAKTHLKRARERLQVLLQDDRIPAPPRPERGRPA